MVTNVLLASLATSKPAAIGLGVAALIVLFLAFKIGEFLIKALLVLLALAAIALAGWWYYHAHHHGNSQAAGSNLSVVAEISA